MSLVDWSQTVNELPDSLIYCKRCHWRPISHCSVTRYDCSLSRSHSVCYLFMLLLLHFLAQFVVHSGTVRLTRESLFTPPPATHIAVVLACHSFFSSVFCPVCDACSFLSAKHRSVFAFVCPSLLILPLLSLSPGWFMWSKSQPEMFGENRL